MARSKKDIEAIVSGMGVFQMLISMLVEKVKELGGTMEMIYRLGTPEGAETLRQVATIIVDAGKKAKGVVTSLADMIAIGKYDWVNSDITQENFPVDPEAKWDEETRLFHFGLEMSTEEVEAEMDIEGWKPAKIWHLLFFGVKNPEFQTQFPIIALGSVWSGLVAGLSWDDRIRRRRLDLGRINSRWNGRCRFLAVRKSSLDPVVVPANS